MKELSSHYALGSLSGGSRFAGSRVRKAGLPRGNQRLGLALVASDYVRLRTREPANRDPRDLLQSAPMRIKSSRLFTLPLLGALVLPLAAQQAPSTATQKPRPGHRSLGAGAEGGHAGPSTDAPPLPTRSCCSTARTSTEWVSTKDKSPARWTVADGVITVNKPSGNIETKRSFKNYQLHLEWRIPEKITAQRPGPRQQRAVPRLDRPRRRRLRAADSRLLRQQDLRERPGGEHLQAVDSAGERLPEAWRMAVLRRGLDGADLQRRRHGEDAGLRDGAPQRRAGPEPLRAEGGDAVYRHAHLQEVRLGADQAAVARRPERADQLPQYLDSGNCSSELGARGFGARGCRSGYSEATGTNPSLRCL